MRKGSRPMIDKWLTAHAKPPVEDTVEKTDLLDVDVDPGLELSRLTEEKSMMTTTDTTMDDDNLSQHTMAMEDDIDSNVNEF